MVNDGLAGESQPAMMGGVADVNPRELAETT
jgi:hypothetical protein